MDSESIYSNPEHKKGQCSETKPQKDSTRVQRCVGVLAFLTGLHALFIGDLEGFSIQETEYLPKFLCRMNPLELLFFVALPYHILLPDAALYPLQSGPSARRSAAA
jgi:hypothetical protein